jgi:hypothetical protein
MRPESELRQGGLMDLDCGVPARAWRTRGSRRCPATSILPRRRRGAGPGWGRAVRDGGVLVRDRHVRAAGAGMRVHKLCGHDDVSWQRETVSGFGGAVAYLLVISVLVLPHL